MPSSVPTYDAIVVGAGAAGSWAVKEVTEGGLKVALLDGGRNLAVVDDFPADARDRRRTHGRHSGLFGAGLVLSVSGMLTTCS